jgi:D-alanyl-lipoteichoic acid acyltransferase DltB (MBOAT superfamily)
MLFHTWSFLVFFLVFYSVFLLLRPTRYWLHWLLLASYFFYGWWNPLYLLLILYSTALDYGCVRRMAAGGNRWLWLMISLSNNLLLLGIFKYAAFVTGNVNALLNAVGVAHQLSPPDLLLPVGISFFTFQSMSYTIDYFRGELDEERDFVRFATFVSLFPQLVAGPIERARTLLPQLRRQPAVSWLDVSDGLSLFLVGLFKKVALADYLALYVDRVYRDPGLYASSTLIVATVAFAWQIYFDFSGYTDMARGVARLMGYRLMLNFRHPYLATGLGDFWSRWHISLSTWFRDYVYIPLGGNRHGEALLYCNLLTTFVISGLWHGAAWTFVVWGLLHGLAICASRWAERSAWYRDRVPALGKQVVVFAFVCFAWIFFRAPTMADATTVVRGIASATWEDPRFPPLAWLLVASVWGYQWLSESRWQWLVRQASVQVALAVAMLLFLCLVAGSGEQAFIYFQF